MKEFVVAAVYTGKSKALVPSRWYKIKASSKSVAAKRALVKAQADNPRYSSYTVTVDTLSARKIKRFNLAFGELRDELKNVQAEFNRYIYYSKSAPRNDYLYAFDLKRLDELLTWHKARYFPILALSNVINGDKNEN